MGSRFSLVVYRAYYKQRIEFLKAQYEDAFVQGAIAELTGLDNYIKSLSIKKRKGVN